MREGALQREKDQCAFVVRHLSHESEAVFAALLLRLWPKSLTFTTSGR